jgi:general nucleoside transport system permease protein
MKLNISESAKEKLLGQLRDLLFIVLSVVLALAVGAILIALIKVDPIQVYKIIISNAFSNFGQVLRRTTVYICTGLAVAIPIKTGAFNMGGEGQVAAGALAAAVIGSAIALPAGIHPIICILGAMLIGTAISSISAYMKIRFGSSEVVTGFMMNYIVLFTITYLVQYVFLGSSESAQTAPILISAKIARFVPGAQWSYTLFIAVAICIFFAYVMDHTRFGLEIKSAGMNPQAAKYQGVNIKMMAMLSFLIGGALAGLGGALEVLGGRYLYLSGYFTNFGYDGIAVAYMARNNPIGVLITSIVMSILKVGAIALDRQTAISSNYVFALQGIIITLLVTPYVVQSLMNLFKRKKMKAKSKI